LFSWLRDQQRQPPVSPLQRACRRLMQNRRRGSNPVGGVREFIRAVFVFGEIVFKDS